MILRVSEGGLRSVDAHTGLWVTTLDGKKCLVRVVGVLLKEPAKELEVCGRAIRSIELPWMREKCQ